MLDGKAVKSMIGVLIGGDLCEQGVFLASGADFGRSMVSSTVS